MDSCSFLGGGKFSNVGGSCLCNASEAAFNYFAHRCAKPASLHRLPQTLQKCAPSAKASQRRRLAVDVALQNPSTGLIGTKARQGADCEIRNQRAGHLPRWLLTSCHYTDVGHGELSVTPKPVSVRPSHLMCDATLGIFAVCT